MKILKLKTPDNLSASSQIVESTCNGKHDMKHTAAKLLREEYLRIQLQENSFFNRRQSLCAINLQCGMDEKETFLERLSGKNDRFHTAAIRSI